MTPSNVIQPGISRDKRRKRTTRSRVRKKDPSGLKRQAFTRGVIVGVPVKRGEHRRHIISSHLMLEAIKAWVAAHDGDQDLDALIKEHGSAQELHNKLNNNINNLIAGPGAENSAIGMYTNYVGRVLVSHQKFSSRELRKKLEKPTGFQQEMQKILTKEAVRVITRDSEISSSVEGREGYLKGLQDSTDFDWPSGALSTYYDRWASAYNSFWSIRNHAGDYSYRGLMVIVNDFLRLPRPVKLKFRGR